METAQLAGMIDLLLLANNQEPLARLPDQLINPFSADYPKISHAGIIRQKDPQLAEELLKLLPAPAQIHLFTPQVSPNPYTIGAPDEKMKALLEQYRPATAIQQKEQALQEYQKRFQQKVEQDRATAEAEKQALERYRADGPIRASQAIHKEYRMRQG